MNNKHTEGPWALAQYGPRTFAIGKAGQSASMLIRPPQGWPIDDTFLADLDLISKALELKEAAEEALHILLSVEWSPGRERLRCPYCQNWYGQHKDGCRLRELRAKLEGMFPREVQGQ